jgi:hypothetical protein
MRTHWASAYREQQARARRIKMEDEQAELRAAEAAIAADEAKAAKARAMAAMERAHLLAGNAARVTARRAAAEAAAEEDRALLAKTLATLEQQERERAEKLKAHHVRMLPATCASI